MDLKLNSPEFRAVIKKISPKEKKTLLKFGKYVRQLRLEKGLSQEKLNFQAGFTKNAIGQIERGEVNCSLLTIEALALGLGISKKKLMDFE